MAISTEIQRLQGAKASLKTSIENKGVTVPAATKIDGYAALVDQIQAGGDTDGLNGFLSVESKTIATSASQTTNIAYNSKCGILDENNKKWDTLAWHQRWVDNGYSATGLSKPTGIWMNALGLEIVYLWPVILSDGYTDPTGTQATVSDTFTTFLYYNDVTVSAMASPATAWPAKESGMISHGTAGKYKSDVWFTRVNGDGLDYVVNNTNEVFTLQGRGVKGVNAFTSNDTEYFLQYNYIKCELYKAMCAICSGIAVPTGTQDGATTTVEILNASGQQPAVNEDMYFWIGGTNTNLPAKYNLACYMYNNGSSMGQRVTQALVDAIYAKQKENGVNMNDTGVNSASKHTLSEGMHGAEAIAVDGYWYIKTPYISNTNTSAFSNSNNNILDDRATYLCKHRNVRMPSDTELLPYWLNLSTHITSLVNLLRTTEGLSSEVPTIRNTITWSGIAQNVQYAWTLNVQTGAIGITQTYSKAALIPSPLSSTQFTT